jgi:hypothetical protein
LDNAGIAAVSVAASIASVICIRPRSQTQISIPSPVASSVGVGTGGSASGTSIAGNEARWIAEHRPPVWFETSAAIGLLL